ncbi:hypothetical protein AB4Z54_05705 [Streptomyces sp. MCAF7]
MTGPYASQAPQALDAADRPDFEQVLHQALNTPEIRTALRNGSAEGPDLEELRSQALADAASIAVAAATEYGAYVRQRAPALPGAKAGAPAASGAGQRLLPALAALTTAAGAIWLFTTAARHRATPVDRAERHRAERHRDGIAAARDAWRLALGQR